MTVPIEHRALRIERSARYFMLGDPREAREVWFALHGYGQAADRFLETLAPLAEAGRCVVAPEALSRFYLRGTSGRVGASWMTREDRDAEVRDYVAYLDAVRAEVGGAGSTGVLGFSQGTATAARWAVLGASAPAKLVLCSGGWPPDLDPARSRASLAETSVTLVCGTEDEHLPPAAAERDESVLAGLGIRVRRLSFAGGHRLDLATLRTCL